MTYILCIEASTNVGSVALLHDGQIVAEQTAIKDQDGDHLMSAIASCLAIAGISVAKLSKIVCGAGPGSFTSLRISAAIAKGIAVGVGCELYSVPSQSLIARDDLVNHISSPLTPHPSPHARSVARVLESVIHSGPIDPVSWEPDYGQKPLAQVKWEAEHGRQLPHT